MNAKRQSDFFIPVTTPFALVDIPATVCSLDLLTPWYQLKFKSQLSEGEQIVLYSIFEQRANWPLAAPFHAINVPLNGRQQTSSHIAAVLARLVEKGVLAQNDRWFRLRNPGLELWMRMRNLNMRDYIPLANAICPVFLRDTDMGGEEFWRCVCGEAGIEPPTISVRRQSPIPPT